MRRFAFPLLTTLALVLPGLGAGQPIYTITPGANASAGAAGSSSGITGTATGTGSLADLAGGNWATQNNQYVGTGSYASGYLVYSATAHGVTLTTPPSGIVANDVYSLFVRASFTNNNPSTGNAYYCEVHTANGAESTIYFYRLTNSGAAGLNQTNWTPNLSHQYQITFDADSLAISISDLTTPTNAAVSVTLVDPGSPLPMGLVGLDCNQVQHVVKISALGAVGTGGTTNPSTSMVASATTIPGLTTTTVTLTGSGTSWGSTTVFTTSGAVACSVASAVVSSPTSATLQVATGPRAGSLVLSDGVDTATLTVVLTVQGNVVFHGDSLTYGTNATTPGAITGTSYPADVIAALGPGWTGTNFGHPGEQISQYITEGPAVDALILPGLVNVLVVQGGTNDLGLGGQTPAQTLVRMQTYVAARKLAGWSAIVVNTITPASHPAYPVGFNANLRDPFNLLLANNWQAMGASALAGTYRDYRIGLSGDNLDPTYFSTADFTHMTDAGYAIAAQYVTSAIASALATIPAIDPTPAKVVNQTSYTVNGKAEVGSYTPPVVTPAVASTLNVFPPSTATIGDPTGLWVALTGGTAPSTATVVSLVYTGATGPATATIPAGSLSVFLSGLTPTASSYTVAATGAGLTASGVVGETATGATTGTTFTGLSATDITNLAAATSVKVRADLFAGTEITGAGPTNLVAVQAIAARTWGPWDTSIQGITRFRLPPPINEVFRFTGATHNNVDFSHAGTP